MLYSYAMVILSHKTMLELADIMYFETILI